MSAPIQSVTTDDERYYKWPSFPGRHFTSITTRIKQGVPKPTMNAWERKTVALTAIDHAEDVLALRNKAESYQLIKDAKKAEKESEESVRGI